jgi:hypothetical protein
MQRYTLPKAFKWLLTPDEDLAGGMYEPTVKKIYDKYGWWICSVYWIGLRNQVQGLLWARGKEVTEDDYLLNKAMKKNGFNSLDSAEVNLGLFKLVFEWEIAHDHYRDYTETGYFAIPKLSFKKG